MSGLWQKIRKRLDSIAAKTLIALAAVALPAVTVAIILGTMLITVVSEAEGDFNNASSAARHLTEIRVLLEREHGLIARLPAELDLGKVDYYAREIAILERRADAEIASLASIEGIVTPEVAAEIAATRQRIWLTVDDIVRAAKSFAQSTALEIVNGRLEQDNVILLTLFHAVASNVDAVIGHGQANLQSGSRSAWLLTPLALVGALAAVVFGILLIRRDFVRPIIRLTEHVQRVREGGELADHQDQGLLARTDEIGALCNAFDNTLRELAEARRQAIANSEAEIAKHVDRLETALTHMSQGLVMFDADQRLIVSNEKYAEIYGLPSGFIKPGLTLQQILQQRAFLGVYADSAAQIDRIVGAIQAGQTDNLLKLQDGRLIQIAMRKMSDGGWVSTHDDVTERKQVESRIAHMARHDALTGLPNRTLFGEKMAQALMRVARGEKLSVLCLDLDHFKSVNDTLGHPIGDALLQAVTERLKRCVRDTDTVARLGGDEFAIIQIPADEAVDATALARRVIDALSAPYDVAGHQVVIGASVGIAVSPGDGVEADQLLKSADMALYRAKVEGRGTYRFFEPAMDARMQARRSLELDLRKALIAGEFDLYYQPLVNLQSNEITSFEALLRWHHPERGLVAPEEFIPLAEEIGLIVPLGEWVIRQACEDAASWPSNVKVAVNLSPVQFKCRDLVKMVTLALADAGLPANRLELEITESVLLQESEATLATLHQLRDLGVRISMDDFGTGYSSLSYLRSFPFDKIKIDQSFIRDLSSREDCVAIVRAVTSLGGSLGMTTTAEGVETQEQLDWLLAEGCTEVQGYFLGHPLPITEYAGMLDRLPRHVGQNRKSDYALAS